MTVHCPHCATGYVLPDHLVGANGSRVRCPECRGAFVVLPENGRHAGGEDGRSPVPPLAQSGAEPRESAGPVTTAAATSEDPARVAAEVLDALTGVLGVSLERSRAEGRVLSQHGPAIFEAFDEYRRRTGSADPAPFREALRERCGLDLSPQGASSVSS
jgi:predicted Zn finger-like uncharacterized protein